MSASREKKLRKELREAEANSDTVKKVKKQKKPMSQVKARKIRSVVGTVVVVALVVAFFLLIFVNSGVLQKNTTAATVGSHKLTPVEYDYFYQDAYNNIKSTYTSYGYWDYMVDTSKPIESQDYGEDQTWGEYIQETALTNAQQVYTLYDAALADGYTLDEDTRASQDSIPDQVESYASQSGYKHADDYLEEVYGKGATVDSYMEYVEHQQIAAGYASEKLDSFTYSGSELRSYYDENRQDFDTVTYRVFTITAEDDDTAAAKSTADDFLAELDGTEKSFSDAAYQYADEDSKESYEDADYTLRSNANYSSVSSDYADWLFADARVSGESQEFPTSSGYVVVMFVSREDNQYQLADVRHILAQVEEDADGNVTDEAWEEAETRINEILAEWEDSDMTEETFAALAEEYSDDGGSNTNGGLYEDIYKGQMVAEFEDWCFDPARKVGDYGVVKTDYGYHLIYFSDFGEEYWKTLADDAKRDADYDAWFEETSASYEGKTKSFGMLFTNRELTA